MSSTRRASGRAGSASKPEAAPAPSSASSRSAAPSASAAAAAATTRAPQSARKRRLVSGPEDDEEDDDEVVIVDAPAASPAAKRARSSAAAAAPAAASIAQLAASPPPAAAAASHKSRKSAAASSAFSAAATPAVRRGAAKSAAAAPVARVARCPECASPLNTSFKCPDPDCTANPARPAPKKKEEKRCTAYPCAWLLDERDVCNNPKCRSNPLYGVQTAEDRERKKALAEAAAAAEEKQQRAKAKATAAAAAAKAAGAVTPSKAKPAASAPATSPAAVAGRSSSAAASSAAAAPATAMRPSSRGRLRAEQSYLDPFSRDVPDDEEADPSFRGGGGGARSGKSISSATAKKSAAPAAPHSPALAASPAPAPSSSRAPAKTKINPRDTDLSLAIALSLTTAAPDAVAHVAAVHTSPESMFDEQLATDPRHASTAATGIYVVHPRASCPPGFRPAEDDADGGVTAEAERDGEEEDEEKAAERKSRRGSKHHPSAPASASAAAAPAVLPQPLLHRSGFASCHPGENGASVAARASAYASLWPSLRRELLAQIQGQGSRARRTTTPGQDQGLEEAGEQGRVFDQILQFVSQSYTDDGAVASSRSGASAQQVATNIVHPTSSHTGGASTLAPFRSHALPVALVHAGLNLEDHPLLMAGLRARAGYHAGERARRDRDAAASKRARARGRAASAGGAKQSYAATHLSHFHRGLSDIKSLGLDRDAIALAAGAGESSGGEEDEAEEHEGEGGSHTGSGSFQPPAPFVATLPATPQSLLALFQSLHASLLDSYPSPRSLSSGSSSAAAAASAAGGGGLTPRKGGLGAHGAGGGGSSPADRGGIEWIIESLCVWMGEHRAEQRQRYAQWRRVRAARERAKAARAAAAAAAAATDMDVDDAAEQGEEEQKQGANGRTGSARKSLASASTTASAAPYSPLDGASDADPDSFYPSCIYPRLLLLLPCFPRFPPAILADLLHLILEHPRLRCWDTLLPVAMVWPVGGGGTAGEVVHSLLPRTLLDRIWFGQFALPPPSALMSRLVSESLQSRSGTLHTPFVLGAAPVGFLLRNFYGNSSSITTALRVVQYALLDHCDADADRGELALREGDGGQGLVQVEVEGGTTGGGASTTGLSGASRQILPEEDGERGCSLSAGFMRAWMRQLKRSQRITALASPSASGSSSEVGLEELLQREDPLHLWVASLTAGELAQLASLPSVRGRAEAPRASALLGGDPDAEAAESFRARIREWLLDLDAHRLTHWRAAQLFYSLCQTAGFFPATAAPAGSSAAPNTQQGVTPELEVWMHSLSFPIFRARGTAGPASASAAAPVLQLHPSSSARFSRPIGGGGGGRAGARLSLDSVLLKFEQPELLRRAMQTGLQRHVDEIAAQETAMRAEDAAVRGPDGGSSSATRVLQRALRNWQAQLDALKAASDPANAATAAAAAGGSGAVRPAPAAPRSASNRTAMLHAAAGITAALDRSKNSSAAALLSLHSFAATLLSPVRSRPLGELMSYERRHRLRALFDPQTEAAVFRALTQSEKYLGADADLRVPPAMRAGGPGSPALSSSSFSLLSSSHSSPDICVAFDIFSRVNGLFVNLRDWFDAFKAAMRDAHGQSDGSAAAAAAAAPPPAKRGVAKRSRGGNANQSSGASAASATSAADAASAALSSSGPDPLSDSSLQVRFLVCLTTLANLGYIKPTNRRVDHVYKLTMHRPL